MAATTPDAGRRALPHPSPSTIHRIRILLVEDDPLLGDGLRAGLRQLGFQVDWVRDGVAAERELRAEPYAAAVLDLGLPLMDGMDVLAARLLVLVLTAVALVWGVAVAQTWFETRHELDELLDSHLAQAAALLVAQQAGEMEQDDGPGIDAPSLHRYAPKVAFQVFHEGRLVLRSANAPLAPMVGSERAGMADGQARERGQNGHGQAAEHGGLRSDFRTVQIAGTDWRVFSATGRERDVQVHVGEQLSSRSDILRAVLRGTVLPLAVALPLLALAVWWAVFQGMAPLRRLSRLIAVRQPQATEPLVVPGAPSELQPVVDGLNGLFERIGALVEGERRFTADAAHELRTPIAAIRTQAQVALAETDDALRRHALEFTLAGCDRATRLVEQLLMLSRVEAGTAPARAPVDLSALVRQQVAELAPRAIDQDQTLELQADTSCTVAGDATLLAVLVRNLVDNALRYSPAGAQVRVAVKAAEGRIRLRVQDSGPGLPPEALARLGERFFRVLGTGQGGSGLGWSIVRRIAAVHGARVRAGRSDALGGGWRWWWTGLRADRVPAQWWRFGRPTAARCGRSLACAFVVLACDSWRRPQSMHAVRNEVATVSNGPAAASAVLA